jgi:hypothetical protein
MPSGAVDAEGISIGLLLSRGSGEGFLRFGDYVTKKIGGFHGSFD